MTEVILSFFCDFDGKILGFLEIVYEGTFFVLFTNGAAGILKIAFL